MKFTLNTKPFVDALGLGIIPANVSKFHKTSCLAQLTVVDKSTLHVNLEAASICSAISLKGTTGDAVEDEFRTIFVDSLLLKQLTATLDSPTIMLELAEGGLIIHSGKSKFNLPKMLDESDISLKQPDISVMSAVPGVDVDKTGWKFIKDYQMYAIAMSFTHPVYTRVWLGADGDVLVGDFDNSLFTHSRKGVLGSTCLVSDTIVNLFNSLPDGAKLYSDGSNYLISVRTDGFELVTQFVPEYESNDDVGDYHSDMILDMLHHNDDEAVSVSASALSRFLNQADLLSSSVEDTIKFMVEGNKVRLVDNNVDCSVVTDSKPVPPYTVEFKTSFLKSVVGHYPADEMIRMCPIRQDDDVVGVVFWNNDVTTVLAGTD